MRVFKSLYSSKYIVVLALLAIFVIMLYCNNLTPLQGDDFCYLYSCKDNTRIENVPDILESMYYHRFTTNGRVIPHFFVQLFLILPLPLFKVINAAMFALYVFLIYRFAQQFSHDGKKGHNVILICVIFGVIWIASMDFGTVFLWLDGSCNYLWCEVFLLIWMYIMAKDFVYGIEMKSWQELLFALYALVIGNYAENSSVAAVFMLLLFIGLSVFYKKEKIKRWHISSLIAMLIGFFFLALAPAELETKIGDNTFVELLGKVWGLFIMYLRFWPLIVFYILAYFYSYRKGEYKPARVLSLVFIGGSFAAHFVLSFALYTDDRSIHITLMLLLLSSAILFYQLFETKLKGIFLAVSVPVLCLTMYWGLVGIRDLQTVHYRWQYNDTIIREAAAAGETEIQVPFIIPDTQYSCLHVWGYLREDPEHYNNIELERYYGMEDITGYFYYDTE